MPSEPPAIPKSTTEARVNLSSGPAAVAEARKNKKKRMSTPPHTKHRSPTHHSPPPVEESDLTDTVAPATQLTPATLTIRVPVGAIVDDTRTSLPLSELSPSPSPIPLPPPQFDTPSSPLTSPPSNAEAQATPRLSPTTTRAITPPPLNEGGDATNNIARLLTLPPNGDGDVNMMNPHDHGPDRALTSVRSMVERIPHNPNRTGRNPIRDPLDNYTDADMPKVHDAHPSTPFQYINLDLISEWEELEGGKLLVIPFGEAAHEPKLHDAIKNRILYAITEITNSQDVGVSAPYPSPEATRVKRHPSSFLVYNLTVAQMNQLLERGIWSSQSITLRTAPFLPTNPDYLFSITGFSLIINQHVHTLIYNIWHDLETANFVQDTVNAVPVQERVYLTRAISAFLDSLSITCLNIKERGGALSPCFNVYADGAAIPSNSIWVNIRQYLSKRIYYTRLTGRGDTNTNPYNCGICHGVDHPRGLCPFPDITGWNGPSKDQNAGNRRGRNGGQLGQNRYGAGTNLNGGSFRM